jgi:hypothetical protein
MRLQAILSVMVAAALLGACNQPAVSLKPPAAQSSENTVRDWNDVADAIAAGMAANGLVPTPGFPASPGALSPVFIRIRGPDSTFLREVASALEADVLQRGGTVARTPDGATIVNLDVDVVAWGPRDKPPGPVATAAALLALPAIVLGDSAPMETWVAANGFGAAIAGLSILTDAAIAMTPTMNAEAVWEATVITGDRLVMKLRQPVYIRGPDIPLYAKTVSLGPVASPGGGTPLRVRAVRYDP